MYIYIYICLFIYLYVNIYIYIYIISLMPVQGALIKPLTLKGPLEGTLKGPPN